MKIHQVRKSDIIRAVLNHEEIRRMWQQERKDTGFEDYLLGVEMTYEDGNYDDTEFEKSPERKAVSSFYDEAKRYQSLIKRIKEEGLPLIVDNNLDLPVSEELALEFYNYELTKPFLRDNLRQVIKHFRPDLRFNVLKDGVIRHCNPGTGPDYSSLLESPRLSLFYTFSSHNLGTQSCEGLVVSSRAHSIGDYIFESTGTYPPTEIEKIISKINKEA